MKPAKQIAFFLCFFIGLVPTAKAQTDNEILIQEIIEHLLETSEEELDFTDVQQDLLGRLDRPLHLNKASFEDFLTLGFLSQTESQAIIDHRESYGDFLGVFELQSVEGLSLKKQTWLSHFTTCQNFIAEEKTTLKKVLEESNGDFMLRFRTITEDQKGYEKDSLGNKNYVGSPYQLYNRVSYRYKNKLSIGYTAEKDMGEAFFNGPQSNGFDYYSAHLYLSNLGVIKQLAVGDYQAQFGQGLNLWSGLAFSKSADAINVARRPRKILPYRSVNETQFFRGAATTLGFDKLEISLFYSGKKSDGTATIDSLDANESYFSALQTSGFHRTESELAKRKKVEEKIAGAAVEYKIGEMKVGAVSTHYDYEPRWSKDKQPYQIHDFEGNNLSNTSLYYNGLIGKFYLFGEVASSDFTSQSLSTVNGAIFSLTDKVEMATIYRYYSPEYNSIYAAPFREQSRAKNESGLYTGFRYRINDAWQLNLYLDRFSFPWLKYQGDAPSKGYEYLTELTYKPSKSFSMYGRIKSQVKEKNLSDNSTPLNVLGKEYTTHYRFQFKYKLSTSVSTTTRIEYATYKMGQTAQSDGTLIFQDVSFKPLEKPYRLIFRYAHFSIDDYNSRIYTYENDVLYAYSIPAYQGKGYRFYALAKLKLRRRIDLWLRWSRTQYYDRDVIGSGNEQINGDHRSEIKAQIRIKF